MNANPVEPMAVADRDDQRASRAMGKLMREAVASTRDHEEAAAALGPASWLARPSSAAFKQKEITMAWPSTSRHQRGYGAAHDKMRALLLRKVVLCEECTRRGRTTLGTIADHIVPLAKGGTGERGNYQLLCKACSDAKTLADKGLRDRSADGVDRSGRPTSADHPWNRR